MKQNFLMTLCAIVMIAFTMTSCQNEDLATPGNKITQRTPHFSYSPSNPACLGEAVTVTFDNLYNNNCGNTQIQQWINGEWIQVAMGTPVNGDLSYTFTPSAVGEYRFRGKWNATGGPSCSNTGANIGFTEEEPLEVIVCGCDDALTAEVACTADACNRTVTFTYTAGDDVDAIVIQGGLTHFTTICTATATGGLVQNTTHPSVTNSNANVTRWEATGVEACDEFTVTITWTSTNNAAEITGQWTVKDGDGNLLAYVCPLDCAGASAEVCE